MVSPHPSTMQKVAEDARRERLQRLAEQSRQIPETKLPRHRAWNLLRSLAGRLKPAGIKAWDIRAIRPRRKRSF